MIASSVDLSDILEVSEEESLGEIQPRFCVALQDYFPQIQRPDQLGFGFSAGQLIKVFGLPNEDGMILGILYIAVRPKFYYLLPILFFIISRRNWKHSSTFSKSINYRNQ